MDPDSSEVVLEARVCAHGALAITESSRSRLLIVLSVVAGIVAILMGALVMGARTREDFRRRETPCTERIQRIERTESIERTCAPDGS